MDEASLLEGLSRCFAALKGYQSRSRAAERCRKFLISVQQEVFYYRSQNGSSPSICKHLGRQANEYRCRNDERFRRPKTPWDRNRARR